MAIYGQEHNYVLRFKKGSDRGTHVVGIKGYLYDMDFDVGKTVLLFTTCWKKKG